MVEGAEAKRKVVEKVVEVKRKVVEKVVEGVEVKRKVVGEGGKVV